jgi:5-methyltetrahydrofolate--homocysteine methyltransferase
MAFVASEMEKAGFTKPLLVGGATTSPLHTALKIAPLYHGAVIHASDASKAIPALHQLLNPETQKSYIETLKSDQQALRNKTDRQKELISLDYARKHALPIDHSQYTISKPQIEGSRVIDSISVRQVAPCIDWAAFLAAWKLPVKYARYAPDAEVPDAEKDKFREALQLINDAKQILNNWAEQEADFIKAIVGFYPVRVEDDSLLISDWQDTTGQVRHTIPLLRQQEKRDDDTYKSLVDFIRPTGDYIGLFTVTAGEKTHPQACSCGCQSSTEDTYRELLEQILKDRLVEAATEYLHEKVQQESGQGIRPASGYPSLPDLSLNFTIDNLLQMNRIGVTLTPNGALYPNATTAGLFITHPEAKYFYIGSIGDDQLADYARKTGRSLEETQKWLGACL